MHQFLSEMLAVHCVFAVVLYYGAWSPSCDASAQLVLLLCALLRGYLYPQFLLWVQVRTELAPWERKVGEATGRIAVATAERDTLARRADEARKRLDAAVKALAGAQQVCGGVML